MIYRVIRDMQDTREPAGTVEAHAGEMVDARRMAARAFRATGSTRRKLAITGWAKMVRNTQIVKIVAQRVCTLIVLSQACVSK